MPVATPSSGSAPAEQSPAETIDAGPPQTAPEAGESAAASAEAGQVHRQQVVHADGYPRTMVKDGISRVVPDVAEETRLRFSGWRLETDAVPERGAFLPAPTTAPDVESADSTSTDARPVRPRRKP